MHRQCPTEQSIWRLLTDTILRLYGRSCLKEGRTGLKTKVSDSSEALAKKKY